MHVYAVLTVVALVILVAPAAAQVAFQDSFERGDEGALPPGWFSPAVGPPGALSRNDPHGGEQCAEVALASDDGFGNLIGSIPIGPMVGKRVRLAAFVQASGDRAQLWLRFDYDDGRSELVDNMHDRPITDGGWNEYEITADVRHASGRAVFGMMVFDGATGRIDDVRLEVVGESSPPEAPRPLEARGLTNLVAFARLLGYVRYFHPSDEAARCDWEAFAIDGARRVESAPDAEGLAATLTELFAPVAPTVEVYVQGSVPPLHAALGWPEGEKRTYVRAWRHIGMGRAQPGIYRSRRDRDRVEAGALAEGWVAPDEPFVAELGDGIVCRVPLSLYGDRRRTFPAAGDSEEAQDGGPSSQRTGDDRGVRLADVVLAWNVFQHFYPYFDVVAVDWPDELARALAAAATDADGVEFTDTLGAMVVALQDGHGAVSGPSRPPGQLPLLWDWIEDELVVTAVGDGVATLAPGDVIVSIDGVTAKDALAAAEGRVSGSLQWKRYRALQKLTVGDHDSRVVLRVAGEGPRKPREETLAHGARGAAEERRPEPVSELEPGIFYLDLGRLTTERFLELVPELAEAEGLVFDMRGYPRGLDAFKFFPHISEETVQSPQWHTPHLSLPDRADMEFKRSNWTIEPKEPFFAAKKAFLIDGRAISYAESCMGIVEHYGLGALVGSPTAGTNGNVNPFALPGGYRVSWTGMKVLKHDGAQHHLVGILPTVPVVRTRAGVREGRDEVLEAGLAAVR